MLYRIPAAGSVGVNKDLGTVDMPNQAWTDANNIRFLDGMALQFFGHSEAYATPPQTPQHLIAVNITGSKYCVYTTASKQYATTSSGGVATHTDITYEGSSDVAVNGKFDTDTAWTKGTGWAIGAGVATATTASSNLTAAVNPLVVGVPYQVTYTVVTVTAGSVRVNVGTTQGTSRTTAGTYTETLVCAGNAGLSFTGTAFLGSIDNVIVKPFFTRTGVVNNWTSTSLSGLPVINVGDNSPPMAWNLKLTDKFVDLPAWPLLSSCKSIRAFKNYLIALNVSRPKNATSISSITFSTTTATLTTTSPHGLVTGDTVTIAGAAPDQYNGTFTITVTGATMFTYTMASAPANNATTVGAYIVNTLANFPFMVKWSHPADPGSFPVSWDHTNPAFDAGELDIAEGADPIVDGLQLRDSFIVYKESSIWRMDYTGGPFVFRLSKVLGSSGALNRNCIVEVDGVHVVLTNQDVIVHDGQTATSVLDKQTRRFLFQQIDQPSMDKAFVFKNTFFNEVYVCFPQIGSSVCDRAMVWNYKDKTVTFRDMPNVHHAAFGPVDESGTTTWSADTDAWASDLSVWNGGGLVPNTARVLFASDNGKLYLLDASAYFDGVPPSSKLERRGLVFDKPEFIKTVREIRPRIKGENGATVLIKVGSSDDPNADPAYQATMTHTIGTTVANYCLVSGRYIAIRFESGTAAQWRLESYDVDVAGSGMY